MTYVDWFNHRRLHGEITDDASYTTPAEAEATYYRQPTTATEVITQWPQQSRDPGRFSPARIAESAALSVGPGALAHTAPE
jgi:hypothetical protein